MPSSFSTQRPISINAGPPRSRSARHETTAAIRVQVASVLAIVFNAIAFPNNQTESGTGPNPRRHIRMNRVVACPMQPKIRVLAAVVAGGSENARWCAVGGQPLPQGTRGYSRIPRPEPPSWR